MEEFEKDFGLDSQENAAAFSGQGEGFFDDFGSAGSDRKPSDPRPSVIPEPICIDKDSPSQAPFLEQLTPTAHQATQYREVPVCREVPVYGETLSYRQVQVYEEIPVGQAASGSREASAYLEVPVYEEVPVVQPVQVSEPTHFAVVQTGEPVQESEAQQTGEAVQESEAQQMSDAAQASEPVQITEEFPAEQQSPAERLAEYADCHYKLLPAGTDADKVNRLYLSALRYGSEWGFCTVMMPVSSGLADALGTDGSGRRTDLDTLRQARKNAIQKLDAIPDTHAINDVYRKKISVMAGKGISVDEFENARCKGAAINCFSSFVKNRVTTCELLMLQVPVDEPWKVFAWISVGGVNGMPSDESLLAAAKHWYGLCGALPAVIGLGVAEFFVPNGRPSRETAMQIAREQFALCHDRVLRLTRSHTLSELTDTLTKSCVWYLGWK